MPKRIYEITRDIRRETLGGILWRIPEEIHGRVAAGIPEKILLCIPIEIPGEGLEEITGMNSRE